MSYNIAKCRYEKTFESGKTKFVTEQYLFDSLSVTETEVRSKEEIGALYSDIEVKDVISTKIAEVMGDTTCGRFWLCKVAFITIDERSGVEKRTISQVLVGAPDFANAVEEFNEGMKSTMADFEVVSLAETPIKEYYPAKLG